MPAPRISVEFWNGETFDATIEYQGGSNWPAELWVLMQHSSIETMMKYYMQLEANQLEEKLWKANG